MTDSQRNKCHGIIHAASASAAGVGAGLAQAPGSDNLVIVPIQLLMTISLGGVFGVKLEESSAAAMLSTTAASMVGLSISRGFSQWAVGWIPIYGNAFNAATAAVVTESLGWALAKSFDSNNIPTG